MKNRILIIEDDDILLKNISEFLEEEGFEVITASDGIEGIKTAESYRPDLIVCDILIPYKNGYQVLNTLSKHESAHSIPFMFLTVKTEINDMRKGMRLGADDYIFKPFDLEDLLVSINMRLAKRDKLRNYYNKTENLQDRYSLDDKILVNKNKRKEFFVIKHIKLIISKTPYVQLKLHDGKTTLQRSSMEFWEKNLPQKVFVRIHRSTIINTDYIEHIKQDGPTSYFIYINGEPKPYKLSKRYSCKMNNLFEIPNK